MGLSDRGRSEGSVVCDGCGKAMPSSLEYCSNCGKKLPAVAQLEEAEIPKERPLSEEDWPMLGRDPRHLNSDGTILQPPLEKVWEFHTGAKVQSSPIPAHDMVFFGSENKNLYALDAKTGQLKWRSKIGKKIAYPVVCNRIVYVVSQDNNLHAIHALTGKEYWQFSTGSHIWSPPAVADGLVFFGSKDKKVYALDTGSGEVRWKLSLNCQVFSPPTIIGNKILIVGREKRRIKGDIVTLYALDVSNGAILWSLEIKELSSYPDLCPVPTYFRTLAQAQDCVFLPKAAKVSIIDLTSGKASDYITFTSNGLPLPVTSLSTNNYFLFIGLGFFHVIARIFPPKLYQVAELKKLSPPAVTEEFIFTAGSEVPTALFPGKLKGTLYGINFSRFTRRWEFDMPHNVEFPPTIANGMLFVSDKEGNIYAFRSGKPSLRQTLEITGEVAEFPKFKTTTFTTTAKFPTMCCLCCGKVEKTDTLEGASPKFSLKLRGVPYCKSCYKKTHGLFGRKEKPGVELRGGSPLSLSFRNEKYWAYFMEANNLR